MDETELTDQKLIERCGTKLTKEKAEEIFKEIKENADKTVIGTPKIGVLVNGYKIVGYLGTGGAGTVCLALKGGLYFAIKFIHVDIKNAGPDKEFLVLHDLLKSESHEKFLTALEWNEWNNEVTEGNLKGKGLKLCYMVMKLVGPSLKSILVKRETVNKQEEEFPFKSRVPYMQKALKALILLHKNKYVHNDVKLENIGVDIMNGNHIYLLDYGLVNCAPNRKKAENERKGTYMYCSRRALKGETQSYRDDCESWFYSFILFLTGQLPWNFVASLEEKKALWKNLRAVINQRILKIMKHIDLLGFYETINFDFVNECLQELINDEAGIPYFPYLYKMSGRKCMQIIKGNFTFNARYSSMKKPITRLVCNQTTCIFSIFVETAEYENAKENAPAVIVDSKNKHTCHNF